MRYTINFFIKIFISINKSLNEHIIEIILQKYFLQELTKPPSKDEYNIINLRNNRLSESLSLLNEYIIYTLSTDDLQKLCDNSIQQLCCSSCKF